MDFGGYGLVMIYLYEADCCDPRTGYGGLFHSLSLALLKAAPDTVACYRPGSLPEGIPCDVDLYFGQPYVNTDEQIGKRYGRLKGIYTMHERQQAPYEFIRCIEKYFDFIIVPTEWCKTLFERIFPDHPVYVSPAGVDTYLYPYYERPADRNPFTFLWQGFAINDRKNYQLVHEAFRKLALPNSRLIIKSFSRASLSKVNYAMHDKKQNESWISDNCNHAEKLSFWQRCDFAVMPSNAEGIGMMPLEWMSSGLPCAFTNNTGAATYCDERFNYPLPATQLGQYDDLVAYSRPTLGSVMDIMNHAYHSREEIQNKASLAAMWIRANHSTEIAAEKLLSTVNGIVKDFEGAQCKKSA